MCKIFIKATKHCRNKLRKILKCFKVEIWRSTSFWTWFGCIYRKLQVIVDLCFSPVKEDIMLDIWLHDYQEASYQLSFSFSKLYP